MTIAFVYHKKDLEDTLKTPSETLAKELGINIHICGHACFEKDAVYDVNERIYVHNELAEMVANKRFKERGEQ